MGNIDGLMQERHDSIANALELRLSCTNPSVLYEYNTELHTTPLQWLFTRSFIEAQIKENIKAPRHWPLCGEFTGTGEFPAQRASNAENGSIWWRHHAICYPFSFVYIWFRFISSSPSLNLLTRRTVDYKRGEVRSIISSLTIMITSALTMMWGKLTINKFLSTVLSYTYDWMHKL